MGHGIKLSEIVEKMNLKNLTPEVDMVEKEVNVPDVNRPALQLAGFYDPLRFKQSTDYRKCGEQICSDTERRTAKRYI